MNERNRVQLSPSLLRRIWQGGGWSLIDLIGPNPREVLNHTAQRLREVIGAEHCAVFRLLPDDPKCLQLEGSSNISGALESRLGMRLRIGAKGRSGMTVHAAQHRRGVILSRTELTLRHKLLTPGGPRHLKNAHRYSMLLVPLINHKKSIVGFIKWENKLNPITNEIDGSRNFTRDDLRIAELISKKVVGVVETMEVFEMVNGVIADMQRQHQHPELLKAILERAVLLLRGFRGDFAWLDSSGNKLVYAAQWGRKPVRALRIGAVAPPNSFVRAVFERKAPDFRIDNRLPPRSGTQRPYFKADPKTKSEIAVRVDAGDIPIGVLNVESSRSNYFSQRDVEVLRLVARHAAIAIQLVRAERRYEELVKSALEHIGPPQEILQPILDAICHCFGFDEGILYRADVEKGRLFLSASRCPGAIAKGNFDPATFSHAIGGKSIANRVYSDPDLRPFKSGNAGSDRAVNQKGRKRFDIPKTSNIFGMPLVFRRRAVGSLVLWNRDRPFPAIHPKYLEPFTSLAAAKIQLWEGDSAPAAQGVYKWLEGQDGGSLAIFLKDREFRFTFTNQAFKRFVKRETENLNGMTDFDLFEFEDARKFREADEQVLLGKVVEQKEQNRLKASPVARHVRVFKRPIRDSNGEISGILGIFWDRSEEEGLELRQRQLLREIPHRVAYYLKTLDSFLSLSRRGPCSMEQVGLIQTMMARIQAMWELHTILYQGAQTSENTQHVSLRKYITKVVKSILEVHGVVLRIKVDIDVGEDELEEPIAFDVGIIVTELVSNAVRHGFPNERPGNIGVRINTESIGKLRISVTDDGNGFWGAERLGVGLNIVKGIAVQQYRGTFERSTATTDGVAKWTFEVCLNLPPKKMP